MHCPREEKTIWQRRAARVGFAIWQGRNLQDMTDAEIQAAFDGLAKLGFSYIWLPTPDSTGD